MDYQIKITCSPDGEFDYEPHMVRLRRGDTVEWICDDGNYALNFGWNTPLGKGRYQAPKGEKIMPQRHPNTRHGRYKYFVAVSVDGKLWTDDPDLIIEP